MSKKYAVKVRVAPKGYKPRTFKGIVSGGNPTRAKLSAKEFLLSAINDDKDETDKIETTSITVTDCKLYNDFVYLPK